MRLYKNCKIIDKNFSLKRVNILVENGKIKRIIPEKVKTPEEKSIKVIDIEDGLLITGLTDIHIHGADGKSFAEGSVEEILKAYNALKQAGTRFILATLITLPPERMNKALEALKEVQKESPEILGAYIEGPFINIKKRGAMKKEFFQTWTPKKFIKLIERFNDTIKMVTVAPEVENANYIIDALCKNGIKVAFGHSEAEYELCLKYEEKVSLFTHIFNAMGTFHHRNPGIVGFALEKNIPCEIIPEFNHLHKATLSLTFKIKGKDNVIPVSDGTPLTLSSKKETKFSGVNVKVKGQAVFTEEGKLFGSAITLMEGLENLHKIKVYSNLEEAAIYNIKNTLKIIDYNPWLETGVSLPLLCIHKDQWRLLTL